MRTPGLAAVLAPLLACSPPPASDTSGTGVPGTTTSTTSGAPDSGVTVGTSSTSSTGDAPTTGAAGTTTTTGPGTTGPASTTALATTAEPGTTSTGGTGEPHEPCPVVVGGDYGNCAPPLGWAFDGVECTPRHGCDCAPDCDKFFPDAATCALTCAAAGHCNEDRVVAGGIAEDPIVPGQFCDGIYLCPGGDLQLAEILEQIFGMLTCDLGNYPCEVGSTCAGLWQGPLGDDEWLKVCAGSLVTDKLWCVLFGP
ncbi:MAG TPA: hypothetical protein VIK91_06985 [Nannocystis sp.]